jgi:hypothetical protein
MFIIRQCNTSLVFHTLPWLSVCFMPRIKLHAIGHWIAFNEWLLSRWNLLPIGSFSPWTDRGRKQYYQLRVIVLWLKHLAQTAGYNNLRCLKTWYFTPWLQTSVWNRRETYCNIGTIWDMFQNTKEIHWNTERFIATMYASFTCYASVLHEHGIVSPSQTTLMVIDYVINLLVS